MQRPHIYFAQCVVVRTGRFEGTETLISTAELPAGLYILRITAENGATKAVRVVKH